MPLVQMVLQLMVLLVVYANEALHVVHKNMVNVSLSINELYPLNRALVLMALEIMPIIAGALGQKSYRRHQLSNGKH